jgi:hypothetical protein
VHGNTDCRLWVTRLTATQSEVAATGAALDGSDAGKLAAGSALGVPRDLGSRRRHPHVGVLAPRMPPACPSSYHTSVGQKKETLSGPKGFPGGRQVVDTLRSLAREKLTELKLKRSITQRRKE